MLPPSKRFKMENSITEEQKGSASPPTATPVNAPLKPCLVSMSPLVIPGGSKLLTTSADLSSSLSSDPSAPTTSNQVPLPVVPTKVQKLQLVDLNPDVSTTDVLLQKTGLETVPCSSSTNTTDTLKSSLVQTTGSVQLQQSDSPESGSNTTEPSEPKELQEGQEIYIQTEQLTVQLAEPGSDGIVIVNGPDGTTMHIQTPEGVPLEAVQALLGIEASNVDRLPQ